MVKFTTGNILEADVEAVVNTVNCVGVMGKGIALQFKLAYPDNYAAYRLACAAEAVQPGRMMVFETSALTNPKYIINFPTKRHWRSRSRLSDIDAGLNALVEVVRDRRIRSLAVPPLGCGNGGLDWAAIKPRIIRALESLAGVEVLVYEPAGPPPAARQPVGTPAPPLDCPRAMLVLLLDRYLEPGYDAGRLELQKLCYFLQESGEPLDLLFAKQRYGPYAEAVNGLLQELEGHYLRGYGDRSGPSAIRPAAGATQRAAAVVASEPAALVRIDRVCSLIDGFETPYGMELLATTHWVAQHELPAGAADPEQAVAAVHNWSERKRDYLKSAHIRSAWERLSQQGWLTASPSGGGGWRGCA